MAFHLLGLKRGVLAALVLGMLTACSTTDEDPRGPWQDPTMDDFCDDADSDASQCNL
jgi:hypothetical protein